MEHSASLSNLLKAFAAAQAEIDNPPNDSTNPHFRSKYASLAAVRNAVVPKLAAHGLSVMQFPTPDGEMVHCETILAHESGEYIRHSLSLPATATQQGYMGGATYAKRMALLALFVIAGDEDDDAEAAMGRTKESQPRREREKRPAPGNMVGPDEAAHDPRAVLLREIARSLKGIVVPLQHAGLYKAILHHCFEAEHHTLKDQPLPVLEAGLPLFRHLCDELQAQHWERAQHPDEWIAQEHRRLAAQAQGDAPMMDAPEKDEDAGTVGASWGPEQPDLMAQEEAEEPWGRPSPDAYPHP